VTLNQASAISAAPRIEVPAAPAFPLAESGRRARLTWPAPMLAPSGRRVWCRRRAGESIARRHAGTGGEQGSGRTTPQITHSRRVVSPVHSPCELRHHGSQPHHALCTILAFPGARLPNQQRR